MIGTIYDVGTAFRMSAFLQSALIYSGKKAIKQNVLDLNETLKALSQNDEASYRRFVENTELKCLCDSKEGDAYTWSDVGKLIQEVLRSSTSFDSDIQWQLNTVAEDLIRNEGLSDKINKSNVFLAKGCSVTPRFCIALMQDKVDMDYLLAPQAIANSKYNSAAINYPRMSC